MISINRFEIGLKSNTFGRITPDENEHSFKYTHMRSGSFGGCLEAASIHSQSVILPNDKDYGFIEEEIARLSADQATKQHFSDLLDSIQGPEKGKNQEKVEQMLDDI